MVSLRFSEGSDGFCPGFASTWDACGFDPKVLFDGFEEEFDLPALAVNFRDGLGIEIQTVGQYIHHILFPLIPHLNAAVIWSMFIGTELADFIAQDVGVSVGVASRVWMPT